MEDEKKVKSDKFIEGMKYQFKVIKTLDLSNEEKFFVLLDEYSTKHLLPFDLYRNYALQPDTQITCYIDKITCSGKIILEPEHPVYKIGGSYEFDFVHRVEDFGEDMNRYGERNEKKTISIIVHDIYGNQHNVECPVTALLSLILPLKIVCSIKHTSKGSFSLEYQRTKLDIPFKLPMPSTEAIHNLLKAIPESILKQIQLKFGEDSK